MRSTECLTIGLTNSIGTKGSRMTLDWLSQAKALPYGHKTKIRCCAADRSCMLSHDAKGYRAWCFRCDPQTPIRFVPHGLRTIAEIQAIRSATQDFKLSELKMPADAKEITSPTAMTWLLRAGLGKDLWSRYGFRESATLCRVIVPVQENGTLNALLLRSLSKDVKPKYILRTRNRHEACVFHSRPDTLLPTAQAAGTVDAYDIVLAEDVLSAIRIGRHAAAGALLGTAVDAERVGKLLPPRVEHSSVEWYRAESRKLRVGLWLDPDKAGRNAVRKLVASLTLQGHECMKIQTERDPKYYSDNQIRSILLAGPSAPATT